MSEKIVQLNEAAIKSELKELVRGSVEETLNELLEAEAEKLTQASRYERNEQRLGYRSGHYNRNLTTTSLSFCAFPGDPVLFFLGRIHSALRQGGPPAAARLGRALRREGAPRPVDVRPLRSPSTSASCPAGRCASYGGSTSAARPPRSGPGS